MKLIEKIEKYLWLLLLIYIGSSQMLKAQDTAHVFLTNYYPIDVCGSSFEKECTISISIGEVKPEDDYYGFDFEVKYDREKFIFNNPLYLNTLAANFDFKDVRFLDSGIISGYCGTLNGPKVYGNKPLIAFKGRYLGTCPDSSYLRLTDINFTDEFKRVVDSSNKFVLVKAEVLEKPNRSIEAGFESDTVIFNEADSTGVVSAKITINNNTRLENIEFELVINDDENFKIEDVKSLTEKLKIDSLKEIENGHRIFTTIYDEIADETVFEIKIKELKRKGEFKELKLTPIKVNDCTCIKELIEDKTIIKGNIEKQDTLGITELENKSINGYYDKNKDKFIIEANKEIKEFLIYDILGNLKKNINISVIDRKAEIEAGEFIQGVYLVTVRNLSNEIKNIVMIKN